MSSFLEAGAEDCEFKASLDYEALPQKNGSCLGLELRGTT